MALKMEQRKGNNGNGFKKGHPVYTIKGNFPKGNIPWNKGKHPIGHKQSANAIEKMRKSKLELYKDKTKHPGYKDGRTFEKRYHTMVARKRQIRKFGNGGYHNLAEWETLKTQYNWTCPCCGKYEPEIKLTEDHIIPLSKGGSDNIENIQPLCRSCNAKKHTKIIKF